MSFVAVTMGFMAAFVLLVPVAMAALVATGGRGFREGLALAVADEVATPRASEPEPVHMDLPRVA